jgi:hypothetical protein
MPSWQDPIKPIKIAVRELTGPSAHVTAHDKLQSLWKLFHALAPRCWLMCLDYPAHIGNFLLNPDGFKNHQNPFPKPKPLLRVRFLSEFSFSSGIFEQTYTVRCVLPLPKPFQH